MLAFGVVDPLAVAVLLRISTSKTASSLNRYHAFVKKPSANCKLMQLAALDCRRLEHQLLSWYFIF